ncbi:FAD-binding protein [Nocardia sp. SYP-A9097]|uniref:FAD-binding oxidoreductase n=1 Tax=Nocardia sp. SYP-A9097 TaxID=2663237 RepID=UPI00129BB34D|nr:FAD-dependent oxidoreductase [Nocardia sp. SYP-A9097]MRH92406.1 FAD-binding protein [Nocardia sp. SYP-A9097]
MRPPFSRSLFLRGALGIGVAGVGFAGATRLSASNAAPAPGSFGGDTGASGSASGSGSGSADPKWRALQGKLRGRVMLPGDLEYPVAKEVFNTRFDNETPTAVVQVADAGDVATAFGFAAENDLEVAARAGGHSYAGVSTAAGSLIIDVRRLRGVRTEGGRAVVSPGHTLYEVYGELDRSGRSLPAGSCPGVGVAGLTLGGGFGPESRAHGLTCDRLTAATLVLPDGTITDVSATANPDLFWALRGGGPLFGIVTSLTFETIEATAKDVVRLTFPGENADRVISGWQEWLRAADREQWANISVDADGAGGLRCWMQLVCPEGEGETVAAALTEAIGVAPTDTDTRTLGHMDTVLYLAGGTADQPRAAFTNGSDIVSVLTPDIIGRVLESVTRFSSVGGTGWVQINTLDGAIRDLSPTATAFPWRDHAAIVEWGAYEPIPHAAALTWLADSHATLAPDSVGAYVNYLEPGDPLSRYYGPNHTRLAQLRTRVDPNNRIRSVLTS